MGGLNRSQPDEDVESVRSMLFDSKGGRHGFDLVEDVPRNNMVVTR